MKARLPEHKKIRALREVNEMLNKKGVTKKELQALLGFLTFCTRVFPLGRPFLRHIFNMLKAARPGKQRITLAAKRDLKWWNTFLPIWSGVAAIDPPRQTVTIATDASGKKGIGGIWFTQENILNTHRKKIPPAPHKLKRNVRYIVCIRSLGRTMERKQRGSVVQQ